MTQMSTAILRQLTTALLKRDFFQVGYLLMAYAETGEDPATLKHRLMSWIAIETLSNVPVDSCCNGDGCICCIDSAGAIISLIQTHLDGEKQPTQYLRQVKRLGVFITETFYHEEGPLIETSAKKTIMENAISEFNEMNYQIEKSLSTICLLLLPTHSEKTDICMWLPRNAGRAKYVSAFPQWNRGCTSVSDAVKMSARITMLDSLGGPAASGVSPIVVPQFPTNLWMTLFVPNEEHGSERIKWISACESVHISFSQR